MFPVILLLIMHQLLLESTSGEHTLTVRNETDLEALLAFKAGLSPQSDDLASWEISTDLCRWAGVICSHKHKAIHSGGFMEGFMILIIMTHQIFC
jgi:hypothetical protein